MLDLIAIAVVLLCMLIGYVRGVLREGLTLGALVVTFYASGKVAPAAAELVLKVIDIPQGAAYTVGQAAAGMIIFLSLLLAIRIADRKIGRTDQGRPVGWNRRLGLLAGLLVGAGLSFCALCVADALQKTYPESEAWWARASRESRLCRLIAPFNPADRLAISGYLQVFNRAAQEPEDLQEYRNKEPFRKLLDHELIQEVLNDEELMTAIHRRNIGRVARDEKIRSVLQSPELREIIFSPEMRQAMREVAEKRREQTEEE